MERHHFFSILIAVCLVVTLALSVSLVVSAQDEGPTVEATVEPTVEPTEEPTAEPTEEPTEEPTAEPTEEPTAEPTEEPTEEPTAEPTEEPTAEPTEEPTAEPTEEPTAEPTAEPTEEPTPTPTPGVSSAEGVTGQQYGGTWISLVAVQNIGSAPTDIVIDWIKNGATSSCAQTTGTNLAAGEARLYSPPAGGCDNNWVGSAIVSGAEPLAAIVENKGSLGQLLSEYTGGSEPTTEVIIIPQTNNVEWDPLIGISNAGNDTANVTLRFLNRDGTEFDTYSPTGGIPAQSGRQIRVRDVIASGWKGSIRIEQTGTPQPLYAVNKAERELAGQTYPVSIAYEGWKVSDANSEFVIPAINKRFANGVPTGQNMTIGVVNPDQNYSVDVTIRWINQDGSELTAARVNYTLAANGTQFETTRDNTNLPGPWNGSGRIEAVYASGPSAGNPAPVIALAQPWVATGSTYGYKAWAVYTPVNPNTGGQEGYAPAVHKESSGGSRVGNGWCTSVVAVNLDTNNTTGVQIDIYDSSDGSLAFTEQVDIPANGKVNWYTLTSTSNYGGDFDGTMGSSFFGGAKVEVVSGSGPIVVSAQQTGDAYGVGSNATSDAYGFYNGVSQ
jgi:hypothetical protein